jgi:tRNA (guanine37-N1)-methyltransferase
VSGEEKTAGGELFECHVLTLFPAFFESPLQVSILGRALERDDVRVDVHDIREHAEGRHRVTDDTPYGGGAGMVMKPGPVVRCFEAIEAEVVTRRGVRPHRVAMTPGGRPFEHADARRLAAMPALSLVCGRYEGFDERVMGFVDEQLSLGDFVLSGGEPAALAIMDAIIRLRPGVLGNAESPVDESFGEAGLLEYPQYTRPALFRGLPIPEILRSGDHARVARWRRGQALWRTQQRRPDLLEHFSWSEDDRVLLEQARQQTESGSPDAAAEEKS